ncbi:MAG: hypothetical protein AAF589_01360 [Planctomycetota bacterium]
MQTINCTITKIANAANAGLQMVVRTISVSHASVSRGVFGLVGRDYLRFAQLAGLRLPALSPACLVDAECRRHTNGQAGTAGRLTKPWSVMPKAGSPGIASIG